MQPIQIAILNQSSVLTDPVVTAALPALQKQISTHFAPHWGVDAALIFFPSGGDEPGAAMWQLILLDDAAQAELLDLHTRTAEALPLLKVFVKTAQDANQSWSAVISHELLEALANPFIDASVFEQDGSATGRIWPVEICDPVQAHTYTVDGVTVSNFVSPFWFESDPPSFVIFDYLQLTRAPFEILPDGYMSYFDVSGGSGWQQINQDLFAGLSER